MRGGFELTGNFKGGNSKSKNSESGSSEDCAHLVPAERQLQQRPLLNSCEVCNLKGIDQELIKS